MFGPAGLWLVSRPAHRDGAGQGEGHAQGRGQGVEPGAVWCGDAEVRVGLGCQEGDGDAGEVDDAGDYPGPEWAAAGYGVAADHRDQGEAERAGVQARR